MTEKNAGENRRIVLTRENAPKLCITLAGILLLLNAVLMALVSNFTSGLIFLGILSAAFIIYGLLWDRLRKARWLHILAAVLCLVLIVFSGFLFLYGSKDNVQYDEDVVIILGAGVRGEEVSRMLAKRLDKAVEYYAKNPDVIFVVSGGQGPQEDISEALAMERYLIEFGIPAGQIIREERSTSTFENFSFSREILEKTFPNDYSVAFITNDFHVYRAERIAQYVGINARHMGASIEWYSVPVTYLREMAAVIQLWFFLPWRPAETDMSAFTCPYAVCVLPGNSPMASQSKQSGKVQQPDTRLSLLWFRR